MKSSAAGAAAESSACRYLQRQGLSLLERNYRCRQGELDLIMRHKDTLVFVEVRQRASGSVVNAAQSVSSAKQKRLIRAAQHYLMTHPQHHEAPMRFDLVAIDGPQLNWTPDVIHASDHAY